ncbi:MAG: OmpW family protein [Proteobacteria bacterium]|nr:OmpW family protein [Pseudomonadota bacterium]MDA1357329.1 OmpW family protein [Pseudomonadota bacterium]
MSVLKIRLLTCCSAILALSMLSTVAAAGDSWLLRLRGIHMSADVSSTVDPIGGSVDVNSDTVPEFDITYFFTDNIAAELILATTRHRANVTGSTLGNVDLGKVSMLPPTLTLQWHFLPGEDFRPYVGAGLNYTFFYDESAPRGTVASINYENNFGYALQTGLDYGIDDHWGINVDIKKVFLSTDVTLNGGAITADVDLDPWIFGLGVAYRF